MDPRLRGGDGGVGTPNTGWHEMEIKLHWRGPLRIPGLVAGVGGAVSELEDPHVYFYVQEYPETGLKIVYVGRADDFLNRMFEHYRYFLGFGYWLRNEKGQEIYEVETTAHLEKLDNIDRSIFDAIQEIKRLSFFCASCSKQHVKAVESALINHVMDRTEKCPALRHKCDNSRRERHGWDGQILTIKHEAHRDFPKSGDFVDLVLGTREIGWGGGSD